MNVRGLLEQVKSGGINIKEAEKQPKNLPYEDLGRAKLDHHRKLRPGFGETVFCQGKPDAYLLRIYGRFYERGGEVLGARASGRQVELVRTAVPGAAYDPISRILKVEKPGEEHKGCVAVCTEGTADMPVAEEATQTTEYFGYKVDRIFDVGIAGVHRLLAQRGRLDKASRIVTVAEMEGTLGMVIAGLVECPIVTVPTSVGYGASFHGLSALLAMLSSCANGISMISIDNGCSAGYLATRANRMAVR